MPYAHQPALLVTAPQKASSGSAPQPAAGREHSGSSDKPQGESCHFQKLPHHHQTSRAATWLWALRLPPPERAKQVPPWRGPQCQHRSHPGHLGQPAACPRGCCCISVGWLLFFMSSLPGGLLALDTSSLNTTGWPEASELGGFYLCSPFGISRLVLPTRELCYCNMQLSRAETVFPHVLC